MTAQPAGAVPPPAAARPTLFAVAACRACRQQVAQVRDRTGRLVQLALGPDGKALRDPAGQWWATKAGGQWRVLRPEPGEDPPAGAWRYAGHRCGLGAAPDVLAPQRQTGGLPEPVTAPAGTCEPCLGVGDRAVPRTAGGAAAPARPPGRRQMLRGMRAGHRKGAP